MTCARPLAMNALTRLVSRAEYRRGACKQQSDLRRGAARRRNLSVQTEVDIRAFQLNDPVRRHLNGMKPMDVG